MAVAHRLSSSGSPDQGFLRFPYVIISFCWAQVVREVGTGVHLPISREPLRNDRAYSNLRGIYLHNKLPFRVWKRKNRS